MRSLYYLKVFVIGYEFFFLLLSLAIYVFFGELFNNYFMTISINEDALKWAMLFPISISGWTLKEGVGVIFPDEHTSKTLHKWPDYWRLKVHFNVGILNSIIYILPCIAVWFIGALNKFDGVWVFLIFSIAVSLNAFSFYAAKISIKSALIRLDE